MAKLRVGVVSPERELWSGEADMVIAKTVDGEIVLCLHTLPCSVFLSRAASCA